MPSAAITAPQLVDFYRWRYAVKRFDPSRKLSEEIWDALEKSLVLTPSSFGMQPWKFIVVSSAENKSKLPAISWNQSQPADCSHMVVFAARTHIDEAYVDNFLNRVADTRSVGVGTLTGYKQVILNFLNKIKGQHLVWSSNQAYIALGQLLASAAILNIDACPMEGIELSEYDKLLGLQGSPYTTVVGCALGYRHPEDRYAQAPKVRFDAADLIQHL